MLQLHLYGGVITCWYLLIYGVSSLAFNHPGWWPEPKAAPVRWERTLAIPDLADNRQLAERVRDELGLMGWPLGWAMRRDSSGGLHFELARPGKKYRIHADRAAGVARVEATSTGLPAVIKALHGMSHGVPNAPFMKAWSIYTEATTWLVVFALGSGVYLWARRARERRAAATVLLVSLASSVGLMVYVYFLG